VGPDQTEIWAYGELLAKYSEFFSAALYGHFAESQTQRIAMPDDDPELIRAYAWWTQTGRFVAPTGIEIEPEELWLLGDKLIAPRFCNDALAALMQENYWEYQNRDPAQADNIWTQVPRVTNLHRYITELILKGGPYDTIENSRYVDNLTSFEERWMELMRESQPNSEYEIAETIRGGHWDHPTNPDNKHKFFEHEVTPSQLGLPPRSSRFTHPEMAATRFAWSSRPAVKNLICS
jgi:hypothetical protein